MGSFEALTGSSAGDRRPSQGGNPVARKRKASLICGRWKRSSQSIRDSRQPPSKTLSRGKAEFLWEILQQCRGGPPCPPAGRHRGRPLQGQTGGGKPLPYVNSAVASDGERWAQETAKGGAKPLPYVRSEDGRAQETAKGGGKPLPYTMASEPISGWALRKRTRASM